MIQSYLGICSRHAKRQVHLECPKGNGCRQVSCAQELVQGNLQHIQGIGSGSKNDVRRLHGTIKLLRLHLCFLIF